MEFFMFNILRQKSSTRTSRPKNWLLQKYLKYYIGKVKALGEAPGTSTKYQIN